MMVKMFGITIDARPLKPAVKLRKEELPPSSVGLIRFLQLNYGRDPLERLVLITNLLLAIKLKKILITVCKFVLFIMISRCRFTFGSGTYQLCFFFLFFRIPRF